MCFMGQLFVYCSGRVDCGHTWTTLERLAQDRSRWRTEVVSGLLYALPRAKGLSESEWEGRVWPSFSSYYKKGISRISQNCFVTKSDFLKHFISLPRLGSV